MPFYFDNLDYRPAAKIFGKLEKKKKFFFFPLTFGIFLKKKKTFKKKKCMLTSKNSKSSLSKWGYFSIHHQFIVQKRDFSNLFFSSALPKSWSQKPVIQVIRIKRPN